MENQTLNQGASQGDDFSAIMKTFDDYDGKSDSNQSKKTKSTVGPRDLEKDTETGAFISKSGDTEAAKRMAKRTLELRAKEIHNKLQDIPIFGL